MTPIKRINEDELVDKINSLIDEGVWSLNVGLSSIPRNGARYSLTGRMADSNLNEQGITDGKITLGRVRDAVERHAGDDYTVSKITYDPKGDNKRFGLFKQLTTLK